MKPSCLCQILYSSVSYSTLCGSALLIGIVSARGSIYKSKQWLPVNGYQFLGQSLSAPIMEVVNS
jgi:hypothetical protein